jgi:hypothetical protein
MSEIKEKAFNNYYLICSPDMDMSIEKKRVWWYIMDGEAIFRRIRIADGNIFSVHGTTSIGNIFNSPEDKLVSGISARKEKRKNGWIKTPTIDIPESSLSFEQALEEFLIRMRKGEHINKIKRGKVWIKIYKNLIGMDILYCKVRLDTSEIYYSSGIKPIGSIYGNIELIATKIEKKNN